jgi:neopullulanase
VTVDTPAWVRDAVFYQIFPDRFAASARVPKPGAMEPWDAPPTIHGFKGGDLLGIAERLDELVDLGVTALYLTPIFSSASNHRYHAYDYLSVDPLLGGDAALRELLDQAHGRGIRVVLDGVFNHCGRGFWQFHHVLEQGAASPYRDWFHLDEAVLAGRAGLNAYPDRSGVDLRVGHPLGYRAWWGLPALPKFNVAHPPVRDHLLSVAEHWLRFGIDGWRLDVPAEIEDETFWQEFRARCRAVNPECYLVGEIWDEAPEWLAGDRFDALMNYPLGAAILGFVGGASLDPAVIGRHDTYARTIRPLDAAAFAERLIALMANYDPAVVASQLNLVGSHDTPRALTVLGGDGAALSQAMTLLLTLPGAPCIYYGDEIGMEGDRDPDCRRSYPADPGAGDRQLRSLVRALVAARHEHVALRRGSVSVAAIGRSSIAVAREADGFRALVALNVGEATERVSVPLSTEDRMWPIPIDGFDPVSVESPADGHVGDGARTLILSPRSFGVWAVGR